MIFHAAVAGLSVVAVLGAAGAWFLSRAPATVAPAVAPASDGPDAPDLETITFRFEDEARHAALAARPPFSPTRRPPPPRIEPPAEAAPEAAAPAAAAPPPLRLLGVIAQGDDRVAVVVLDGDSEARFLRRGASIAGWRIVSVDDKGIVVENFPERVSIPVRQSR